MATLLLFLAALLAVVGAILWFTASSQERSQAETPREQGDETVTTETEPGEDPFADELNEDVPVVHTPTMQSPAEQSPAEEPAPAHDPTSEGSDPANQGNDPANQGNASSIQDDVEDEEAAEEQEPKDAARNAKASPKLKNRFPLGVRRERRAWAEARGWDFRKTDSYLVDEWTRGAAATGAAPRDIAVGEAYGHETLLMDIGGVNVMAMRTGALSGVVVDMRREGMTPVEPSDDLLAVTTIGDFEVLATDAGATARMVDERVTAGLEEMPANVIAAWIEGDWALAQTTRDARQETWEAMLAPLALLADAARCLPPRDAIPLRVADLDPSREIPDPEPTGASLSVVDDGPVDEFENPPVQRPETPMTLPSRKRGEARGEVEARPLGGDEVGAIADGEETPTPHLPREMKVSPALAAERARLDRQLGRH